MEHGGVGMAFGRAGLGYDIRLACHGLDRDDNDFVVGLLGPELHPLSIIVQRMRKTKQTSLHLERLGPFFVGRVAWQSSRCERRQPASTTDVEPTSLVPPRVPRPAGRAHARLAPPAGGPLPARVPRDPGEALDARGDPHARARGAGDAAPGRLVRPRRGDRLLGHPPAARRDGPRPRLREGRRAAGSATRSRRRATSTCSATPPAEETMAGTLEAIRIVRTRARAARRPRDRLRGRALHARELRDRGRHVEGLHEDEGVHALRARGVEAPAREARHRAGRLPARAGRGGRAGAAGVRLVGRARARARGLPALRRAAQPRAVRDGRRARACR